VNAPETAVVTVDNNDFFFLIVQRNAPRTMKAGLCTNAITEPRHARGIQSGKGNGCSTVDGSHLSGGAHFAHTIVQAVCEKHNVLVVDGDPLYGGKSSISPMPVFEATFVLAPSEKSSSRFRRVAHLERRANAHEYGIVSAIGVHHGDGVFGMHFVGCWRRIRVHFTAHVLHDTHIEKMRDAGRITAAIVE